MDTTINFCESITNRNIIYSVNKLEEFINLIKSDKPENEMILSLRKLERESPKFDDIKKNKIPCAVLHFNYSNGYINSKNTLSATGYLYFDIDETTEGIEAQLQQNEYVAAYWKSVSGRGYGFVVNILGITLENYKLVFSKVAKMLGLPIDTQAKSVDRLTVLSYDPNAHYNTNATCIKVEELDLPTTSYDVPNFRNSINKAHHKVCNATEKYRIRYNNFDEVIAGRGFNFVDGVYDCKDNKIPYTEAFIPNNIKKGNREKSLGLFCKNFVILNPHFRKEYLKKQMMYINNHKMEEPLNLKEFNIIINKCWKCRGLQLVNNKTKRFVFENPNMSIEEKRKIVVDRINEDKREKTRGKEKMLEEMLENWDYAEGKITAKNIMAKEPSLKKTFVYEFLKNNPHLTKKYEE